MNSHVDQQISGLNSWYVDDQRDSQLGSAGARWALEGRWRLFEEVIGAWVASRDTRDAEWSVLDAGCGDGINLHVLADITKRLGNDALIVGADYNPLRLKRAGADWTSPLLRSDLGHMPFHDSAFDIVLCSHVLEHVHDDVGVLKELARLIKPQGLLLLATPNEGCAVATIRNHVVQRAILRTTDHVNFYTERDLLRRVRTAGLRPLDRTRREGVFMPHLGLSYRLRESPLGRRILVRLARAMPSQSAGLIIALTK